MDQGRVTVVIPARNEARTIGEVAGEVLKLHPGIEVMVVDDGSTDGTGAVAKAAGAKVIRHPASRGNGAAVKTGARAVQREIVVFMDGDGQHRPADIAALVEKLGEGYDMVVGARSRAMHAGVFRLFANWVYNTLASWITGTAIRDLTSGFRAARAAPFRSFLSLLPNGFSYPTTSTMAFLRAGYHLTFVPIEVQPRKEGTQSHIRLFHDGGRFLIIIFRVGTLYSPLKIFLPVGALFFLVGAGYYVYTFATVGRFTNMSALLLTTAVLIFLIGLVSEQITQLLYSQRRDD